MNVHLGNDLIKMLLPLMCLYAASCTGADTSGVSAETTTSMNKNTVVQQEIESVVAGMDDAMLASQVLIIHLNRDRNKTPDRGLNDEFAQLVESVQPGGVILYSENILGISQVRSLNQDLESKITIPPFIAVDEEGGRVSRLQRSEDLHASKIPAAATIAKGGAEAVWFSYLIIGRELAALGFNMDFAPVADLGNMSSSDIVGDRALGNTPEDIGRNCGIAIKALKANRIIAVAKHFPGHGRSKGDSHFEMEEINEPWETLLKSDIKPFADAFKAGVGGVMTAHIWYSGVEPQQLPVSMSSVIIQNKLREDLGFKGLVITDALDMKGVLAYGDSESSAIKSLKAGADMLLCPVSPQKQVTAICKALADGTLDRDLIKQKVVRILKTKLEYGVISISGGKISKGKAWPVGDEGFVRLDPEKVLGSPLHKKLLRHFVYGKD